MRRLLERQTNFQLCSNKCVCLMCGDGVGKKKSIDSALQPHCKHSTRSKTHYLLQIWLYFYSISLFPHFIWQHKNNATRALPSREFESITDETAEKNLCQQPARKWRCLTHGMNQQSDDGYLQEWSCLCASSLFLFLFLISSWTPPINTHPYIFCTPFIYLHIYSPKINTTGWDDLIQMKSS